jgi:hypothetical protein
MFNGKYALCRTSHCRNSAVFISAKYCFGNVTIEDLPFWRRHFRRCHFSAISFSTMSLSIQFLIVNKMRYSPHPSWFFPHIRCSCSHCHVQTHRQSAQKNEKETNVCHTILFSRISDVKQRADFFLRRKTTRLGWKK